MRAAIAGLLVAALLPVFAWADRPYLESLQPDGVALLPSPPAPGSAEEAADLATVRTVCRGRSSKDETQANISASLSIFLFAPAIDPEFRPGQYPRLEALFQKVRIDINDTIDFPKKHWKRARPYESDRALLLGEPERSPSYPSGHSAHGIVVSLLLAELFPEHKDAIHEYGCKIGWDRIVLGKHYPTDVYAGRVLGKAIVRGLMANPEFLQDFADAKAEVQTVRAARAVQISR
jgi:acid phosphatase (class A)